MKSPKKMCLIPARGGSKRVPGKNKKLFCGKPILAYSIEAAQSSKLFDRIIVSTDNPEVADIARQWGADVPFMRPAKISDDHTPTIPVVRHAVDWLQSQGEVLDAVCCLYATAPFVTPAYILDAYKLLMKYSDIHYVFPVAQYSYPIHRALAMDEEGNIQMMWPENEVKRSQDLSESFHDAGQFYWGSLKAWKEQDTFFSSHSKALLLPRQCVQDIDTQEDWDHAERMFQVLNYKSGIV